MLSWVGALLAVAMVVASCSSEADPGGEPPGSAGCRAGEEACAGVCVNLRSSASNCGRCGAACGAGTVCSLGVCSGGCAAGLRLCGAECVSLAEDARNCGSCGNACATGQSCSGATCGCGGAGQPACAGAGGAAGSGGSGGNGGDAGSGGATSDGGTSGTGSGLRVGGMCFPVCASAMTDADLDGYGFEGGRSCVVTGSAPTAGAASCVPPPPVVPVVPPGDGFLLGGMCHPRCSSAATDADPAGVTDGYGYEGGRTCIVVGSSPAMQGVPCVPSGGTAGDGYLVAMDCVGACLHPELANPAGYGYEAQRTCVVTGSTAALQSARCALVPRTLPPPGPGTLLGETCFPRCGPNALDVTPEGYGWDVNRTCVVATSNAVIQGLPCVPPASTLTGECPRVLVCPVVSGVTLACGCTWIEGLRERKMVIMATAGATQYFVASAMMETADLTSNYTLGDGKSNDAFNAGIAKQNWGMARRCHPAWAGFTEAQFMTATAMNSSLALDIQVYNECRTRFGVDWWSGHRNGFASLGSTSQDIQQFKGAMDWTSTMLTGHLADDVRFWVMIQAI